MKDRIFKATQQAQQSLAALSKLIEVVDAGLPGEEMSKRLAFRLERLETHIKHLAHLHRGRQRSRARAWGS